MTEPIVSEDGYWQFVDGEWVATEKQVLALEKGARPHDVVDEVDVIDPVTMQEQTTKIDSGRDAIRSVTVDWNKLAAGFGLIIASQLIQTLDMATFGSEDLMFRISLFFILIGLGFLVGSVSFRMVKLEENVIEFTSEFFTSFLSGFRWFKPFSTIVPYEMIESVQFGPAAPRKRLMFTAAALLIGGVTLPALMQTFGVFLEEDFTSLTGPLAGISMVFGLISLLLATPLTASDIRIRTFSGKEIAISIKGNSDFGPELMRRARAVGDQVDEANEFPLGTAEFHLSTTIMKTNWVRDSFGGFQTENIGYPGFHLNVRILIMTLSLIITVWLNTVTDSVNVDILNSSVGFWQIATIVLFIGAAACSKRENRQTVTDHRIFISQVFVYRSVLQGIGAALILLTLILSLVEGASGLLSINTKIFDIIFGAYLLFGTAPSVRDYSLTSIVMIVRGKNNYNLKRILISLTILILGVGFLYLNGIDLGGLLITALGATMLWQELSPDHSAIVHTTSGDTVDIVGLEFIDMTVQATMNFHLKSESTSSDSSSIGTSFVAPQYDGSTITAKPPGESICSTFEQLSPYQGMREFVTILTLGTVGLSLFFLSLAFPKSALDQLSFSVLMPFIGVMVCVTVVALLLITNIKKLYEKTLLPNWVHSSNARLALTDRNRATEVPSSMIELAESWNYTPLQTMLAIGAYIVIGIGALVSVGSMLLENEFLTTLSIIGTMGVAGGVYFILLVGGNFTDTEASMEEFEHSNRDKWTIIGYAVGIIGAITIYTVLIPIICWFAARLLFLLSAPRETDVRVHVHQMGNPIVIDLPTKITQHRKGDPVGVTADAIGTGGDATKSPDNNTNFENRWGNLFANITVFAMVIAIIHPPLVYGSLDLCALLGNVWGRIVAGIGVVVASIGVFAFIFIFHSTFHKATKTQISVAEAGVEFESGNYAQYRPMRHIQSVIIRYGMNLLWVTAAIFFLSTGITALVVDPLLRPVIWIVASAMASYAVVRSLPELDLLIEHRSGKRYNVPGFLPTPVASAENPLIGRELALSMNRTSIEVFEPRMIPLNQQLNMGMAGFTAHLEKIKEILNFETIENKNTTDLRLTDSATTPKAFSDASGQKYFAGKGGILKEEISPNRPIFGQLIVALVMVTFAVLIPNQAAEVIGTEIAYSLAFAAVISSIIFAISGFGNIETILTHGCLYSIRRDRLGRMVTHGHDLDSVEMLRTGMDGRWGMLIAGIGIFIVGPEFFSLVLESSPEANLVSSLVMVLGVVLIFLARPIFGAIIDLVSPGNISAIICPNDFEDEIEKMIRDQRRPYLQGMKSHKEVSTTLLELSPSRLKDIFLNKAIQHPIQEDSTPETEVCNEIEERALLVEEQREPVLETIDDIAPVQQNYIPLSADGYWQYKDSKWILSELGELASLWGTLDEKDANLPEPDLNVRELEELRSNLRIEFYESLSVNELRKIADEEKMTYVWSYNGKIENISSLKEKFRIIKGIVRLNYSKFSDLERDIIHQEYTGASACKFDDIDCDCIYKRHCFDKLLEGESRQDLFDSAIYRYSPNLYMNSDYLNMVNLMLKDYSNVSLKFLKPYAKKRGIKISGSKSDIVSRLENSDDIVQ